ncbi:MAG: MerR family transcriptional regulator [Lachnospiraceae bacterium]|nr:MerR family transcriptional regulator [Lachnospiraceae bacterium]
MGKQADHSSDFFISAGDFASFCKTTRDTLRYYSKQGILVPYRNPENGYHYYSVPQLGSFFFILTFRKLGYSVDDIRKFMDMKGGGDPESFISSLYDMLISERDLLDERIAQTEVSLAFINAMKGAQFSEPRLAFLPGDIYFKISEVSARDAKSLGDIYTDARAHITSFETPESAFPVGVAMDAKAFMNGDYTYRKVFSLMTIDSEGAAAEEHPERTALGSRKIAIIMCRDSDGDIKESYRRLADFIKDEELKVLSDVYSLSLVNMMDPTDTRRFFKYIFAAVE